jgi:hypothetical protein
MRLNEHPTKAHRCYVSAPSSTFVWRYPSFPNERKVDDTRTLFECELDWRRVFEKDGLRSIRKVAKDSPHTKSERMPGAALTAASAEEANASMALAGKLQAAPKLNTQSDIFGVPEGRRWMWIMRIKSGIQKETLTKSVAATHVSTRSVVAHAESYAQRYARR